MSITALIESALADVPAVLTPKQLGELLDKSTDALCQERWLGKGIPFIKYGGRIYYLRSDVTAFFAANRHSGGAA
jgi:hypothetical protein